MKATVALLLLSFWETNAHAGEPIAAARTSPPPVKASTPAPVATPPFVPEDWEAPSPTRRLEVVAMSRPGGSGYLTVAADPWCGVRIDGERVAERTPLDRFKLSSGLHVVRFDGPHLVNPHSKSYEIEVPIDGEVRLFVDVKTNTVVVKDQP